MDLVQEFVSNLSETHRLQIISDYEEFKCIGAIGTSTLREVAEELNSNVFGNQMNISLCIRDLYFAVAEYYMKKHLEINDI